MELGTEKCTIHVNIIRDSWQNLDKDNAITQCSVEWSALSNWAMGTFR